MFQFSGFAPTHYVFMCRSGQSQGFPHSEIIGSKPVRSSPTLIAAYHVLHRLSVPRHPPIALKSLDRSHYRLSPVHLLRASSTMKTQILLPSPLGRGRGSQSFRKTLNLKMPALTGRPSCSRFFSSAPSCREWGMTKNVLVPLVLQP